LLYHADIGPDFKHAFEEFVNTEYGVILIAEHSGKVVGILIGSYCLDIDWEGKIAKIDALIVDEAFRRIGIGRKLFSRLIAMAKKRNCKAIKSRVNIKNLRAQKFHEKLGFERANTYEYMLELHKRGRL